jgi:hypothetical protein
MSIPSARLLESARRILEHEAQGADGVDARAEAAGRVHAKTYARVASLVGRTSARALFHRSVRLAAPDFPFLGELDFSAERAESPAQQFVATVQRQSPEVVAASTVLVCATLLGLLTTLIGAALTQQLLRSAWPAVNMTDESPEA